MERDRPDVNQSGSGRLRLRGSAGGVAAVAAAVAIAVFASAAGSQPGSAAPVLACARNDGERLLRLIVGTETCAAHETRVSFPAGGGSGSGGAVTGLETVQQSSRESSQVYQSVIATCPDGKRSLGGGFEFVNRAGGELPVSLEYSRPTLRLQGWQVSAHLNGDFFGRWQVVAHVVCAV